MVTVRPAEVADAAALGEVHVRAWQTAYRGGLMPDAYLDSLSGQERAAMWSQTLREPPPAGAARLVALNDDGALVGFVVVGPCVDADASGEVFALNVEPDAWGAGAGTALLRAGVSILRDSGYGDIVLWVHPGNSRARRFYERHGWRAESVERRQEVLGVDVPEVRYRLAAM